MALLIRRPSPLRLRSCGAVRPVGGWAYRRDSGRGAHQFQSPSDGLIISNLDGIVVEANPAACEMLGYEHDELIGMQMTSTVTPGYETLLERFATFVSAGDRFHGTVVCRRKDGSSLDVDVHGTPFQFRGQPHVLMVSRDISEQVEAYQILEQRVAERTKEIRTLLDVSHNVAATLELRPLLSLLLDGLSEVLEFSGAAISTFDDRGLNIAEYSGPVSASARADMQRSLEAIADRETVRSGESVIIGDTSDESEWARFFRTTLGDQLESEFSHVRSFMAVPLMLGDRFTGLLTLVHSQPGYYSTEQLRLASAMADQAAVAIENARLYEQAQHVAAHEERSRLARELHDSVTQALFSMTLHARAAQMAAKNSELDPQGPVAVNLELLAQLTQAALAEMRALILSCGRTRCRRKDWRPRCENTRQHSLHARGRS
jgi:PAS domain S-box-containing protein